MVVRHVSSPAVVLGNRQPVGVLDGERCAAAAVRVLRRRSGGGGVLVGPTDPLWVDMWVPRADPLWSDDVVMASVRVGEWWLGALRDLGAGHLRVHRGRAVERPGSDLCCFAGTGPGELLEDDRKLVGLAQWRCRQGALFHCALYRHWDPGALAELFAVGAALRDELVRAWRGAAVGLDALPGRGYVSGPEELGRFLGDRLPDPGTWRVVYGMPVETNR